MYFSGIGEDSEVDLILVDIKTVTDHSVDDWNSEADLLESKQYEVDIDSYTLLLENQVRDSSVLLLLYFEVLLVALS